MNITLPVSKALVLLTDGQDEIHLTLATETTYPKMKLAIGRDILSYAEIKTQADYGIEWCRKVLGIEPEVKNDRKNANYIKM